MCRGCWINDHGAPMVNTDEVLVAAELIRRLYEDHNEPLGGPLHAMLDDMNIDDEQIESDYYTSGDYAKRATFEGVPDGTGKWVHHDDLRCTPEVKELCELILYAFRQMPESHRAAAIAWYSGWAFSHASLYANGENDSKASPGDVIALVAEWTTAKNAPRSEPGATKACAPIPCPPFSDEPRLLWSETTVGHPGSAINFLGDLSDDALRAYLPPDPVQVSGTVWPGVGRAFAPDARITGRSIVDAVVNPDGSATVTWSADAIPAPTFDMRGILEDPRSIRPTYPDRAETD